jgi:peroxiredoxin
MVLTVALAAMFGWVPGKIDAEQTERSLVIRVGDVAPKLEFKDIRFVRRALNDIAGQRATVLVFATADCPVARRYWPTIKRLEAQYRNRGVQFVAINVGADDSIMNMAEQAMDYELEFPVLKDFDAVAARTLGVTRVPSVVVLDRECRLRYRGRIDDQYQIGGTRPEATKHELQDTLESLLSGREIATTETSVEGCLITVDELRSPKGTVTFAEQVAPIARKHCAGCHRPNTAAPFSLLNYQDFTSHADMIAEVVREQRMPPWYGSPKHGHFENRRGLTADERATVLHWVRSGKPRGDDSKLPSFDAPAEAFDKWLIGEPDLIVKELIGHTLPAEGVIPYRYSVLPHVFTEETWIKSIQILPDNPAVVHHCNTAYFQLGEKLSTRNFVTGFVPGGQPMTLPDGVAVRIPAGSVLGLQIHFVSTGKPEQCRIAVGLKFARGTVQKQLRFHLLDDHKFAIPPGAAMHPVKVTRTLERDATGIGLFCHMHLRGRDMTFTAHRPDQSAEKLLVIPNFNFNWQHGYQWAPGQVHFPKGTQIEVLAHFDNSVFNTFNPDPTKTVREGPQSFDEMINGFFFYVDSHENLNLKLNPTSGTALPSN